MFEDSSAALSDDTPLLSGVIDSLGLMQLISFIEEEFDVAIHDVFTTMLGLEALGYGYRDNGLVFSLNAHMWTSEIPIWTFGSQEQRERWLAPLCDGRSIGCHTITEPEAGSDAFAMRSSATRVEG